MRLTFELCALWVLVLLDCVALLAFVGGWAFNCCVAVVRVGAEYSVYIGFASFVLGYVFEYIDRRKVAKGRKPSKAPLVLYNVLVVLSGGLYAVPFLLRD